MSPQANIVVEDGQDISSALKELDRRICAAWPAYIAADAISPLLDSQGRLIEGALDDLRTSGIETVAHALFHEFSQSPAHRQAAERWFAENRREAKKTRFVYDRFDGLARLNRLKDAFSRGELDAKDAGFDEEPAAAPSLEITQASLQFLYVQPNIHGVYPPETIEQIRRARQNRCYLFLAFPPKCGGTFIRDVLGRISGAGPIAQRPGHALGGRDVEPYLPMMAAQMLSPVGPKAFMTHAHMIGHYANIQTLNLFGIKPVVMKRNIPDMLHSFADMADSEGRDSDGGYNWSLLCGVHTDASFLKLSREARADFLVYHQAPWYIQFYASWLRASRTQMLPVHWTAYDEFRADPARTIAGILEFYAMGEKIAAIPRALARAQANKASLRFNKGVSGRGASLLQPQHLSHLHQLAKGYADIDFVAEGLLPPLPPDARA